MASVVHVNELRTDLRHDVDHGDAGKVRAKRRKAGSTFALYGGTGTLDTIEPVKFPLVQSNVLSAIEGDDSVERVLIETGLVRDHPTESKSCVQ